MSPADELTRLHQQADAAQACLNGLVERREASLDGAGLMPTRSDIEKAQARLEVAQALLRAHQRMAVRS
ncbi:hypothetical protein [Mesorhizobium sp. M1273]|uniref:hypothetical protein n=1 Tax=Mesorhizobium sp. M1273 TaxID=2957075 RepID=UPI00333DBADB